MRPLGILTLPQIGYSHYSIPIHHVGYEALARKALSSSGRCAYKVTFVISQEHACSESSSQSSHEMAYLISVCDALCLSPILVVWKVMECDEKAVSFRMEGNTLSLRAEQYKCRLPSMLHRLFFTQPAISNSF